MKFKTDIDSNNVRLQEVLSIIEVLPDLINSTDIGFSPVNSGGGLLERLRDNNSDLQKLLNIVKAKSILIDFEFVLNDDGSFKLTAWRGTFESKNSKHLLIPDTSEITIEL